MEKGYIILICGWVFISLAIIIVPKFTLGSYWWEEKQYEVINRLCSELMHPELNTTQYELYRHCTRYPETYGVKD